MLVARLLGNKKSDAGRCADELSHDQIGPGPAKKNPLVAIELRHDGWHHDVGEQPQFARAERQSGFDQKLISLPRGVGDDQNLLEKCTDDDDRDLGSIINPRESPPSERRRRGLACNGKNR